MAATPLPRLYDATLAPWWPLLSPPEEDADEAAWILKALCGSLGRTPAHILELGSGGGNIASHLTPHARLTLVDLSPDMLAVSRRLNPDTEHIEGDMRSVRVGRTFDAVMIHDAIMYMTTERDLVTALATAHAHLKPDGALIVIPDHVAETYEPGIETGGSDAPDGRGLRYIIWRHPPAPGGTTYDTDFAILTRHADGLVEAFHDRHTVGLFSRDTWRKAFGAAGFAPPAVSQDPWRRDVWIGRPAASAKG
jgi:SAM-dependent methyltransferase